MVHFSVIKPYVGGTFLLYQSHRCNRIGLQNNRKTKIKFIRHEMEKTRSGNSTLPKSIEL